MWVESMEILLKLKFQIVNIILKLELVLQVQTMDVLDVNMVSLEILYKTISISVLILQPIMVIVLKSILMEQI